MGNSTWRASAAQRSYVGMLKRREVGISRLFKHLTTSWEKSQVTRQSRYHWSKCFVWLKIGEKAKPRPSAYTNYSQTMLPRIHSDKCQTHKFRSSRLVDDNLTSRIVGQSSVMIQVFVYFWHFRLLNFLSIVLFRSDSCTKYSIHCSSFLVDFSIHSVEVVCVFSRFASPTKTSKLALQLFSPTAHTQHGYFWYSVICGSIAVGNRLRIPC